MAYHYQFLRIYDAQEKIDNDEDQFNQQQMNTDDNDDDDLVIVHDNDDDDLVIVHDNNNNTSFNQQIQNDDINNYDFNSDNSIEPVGKKKINLHYNNTKMEMDDGDTDQKSSSQGKINHKTSLINYIPNLNHHLYIQSPYANPKNWPDGVFLPQNSNYYLNRHANTDLNSNVIQQQIFLKKTGETDNQQESVSRNLKHYHALWILKQQHCNNNNDSGNIIKLSSNICETRDYTQNIMDQLDFKRTNKDLEAIMDTTAYEQFFINPKVKLQNILKSSSMKTREEFDIIDAIGIDADRPQHQRAFKIDASKGLFGTCNILQCLKLPEDYHALKKVFYNLVSVLLSSIYLFYLFHLIYIILLLN